MYYNTYVALYEQCVTMKALCRLKFEPMCSPSTPVTGTQLQSLVFPLSGIPPQLQLVVLNSNQWYSPSSPTSGIPLRLQSVVSPSTPISGILPRLQMKSIVPIAV